MRGDKTPILALGRKTGQNGPEEDDLAYANILMAAMKGMKRSAMIESSAWSRADCSMTSSEDNRVNQTITTRTLEKPGCL
jgi:hypothetical protein